MKNSASKTTASKMSSAKTKPSGQSGTYLIKIVIISVKSDENCVICDRINIDYEEFVMTLPDRGNFPFS